MAMNLENANIIEVNTVEKQTDQPSYFSVIPANVRYDSDLSPYAILLYGEITALTHKNGYCYASNTYFAKRYDRTPQAVSKWINQLASKGYINIVYCKCKNIIVERRIYITSEVSTTVDRVSTPVDEGINQELIGYQQTIKENNKSNNKLNNKSSSTSLNSEPPKFNQTKKVEKKKRVTAEEKHKEYLSSLPSEIFTLSEKCADKLISYLIKLQNSQTAATHKLAWQEDFARFIVSENKSESEIISTIDFAMTGWWSNKIFSVDGFIKQYGKLYQQMHTKTQSNSDKNVSGVNMTCDRDSYDTTIF